MLHFASDIGLLILLYSDFACQTSPSLTLIPQQELQALRAKVVKFEEETRTITEQNAELTAKNEDLEQQLQEERDNSTQV